RLLHAGHHGVAGPAVALRGRRGGGAVRAGVLRRVLAARPQPEAQGKIGYAARLAESSVTPSRKTKAAPAISIAAWTRFPARPSPASATAQFFAVTAIT